MVRPGPDLMLPALSVSAPGPPRRPTNGVTWTPAAHRMVRPAIGPQWRLRVHAYAVMVGR